MSTEPEPSPDIVKKCEECGYVNPSDKQWCGACGMVLRLAPETGPTVLDDLAGVPDLAEVIPPEVLELYPSGRRHDAHRALTQARGTPAQIDRRKALARVWSLWVEPMGSAPTLLTFNSIGTALLRRSPNDAEGRYRGVVYLVVLYVIPVAPLSAWLVSDGPSSWRSSYHFYGKLPS